MTGSDPRALFAAERAILAWVRTGLGFVVARFGLLLHLARGNAGAAAGHGRAPGVGVALAALGTLAAGTPGSHPPPLDRPHRRRDPLA